MSAPLDQAIIQEFENGVKKEFTVYYKKDNQLYQKTTTRNYNKNDFLDSTTVIAIGKTDA